MMLLGRNNIDVNDTDKGFSCLSMYVAVVSHATSNFSQTLKSHCGSKEASAAEETFAVQTILFSSLGTDVD